jgi:hypothetical protein
MSWSYLEEASGEQGHADRICVPGDEAELLALLAEAKAAGAGYRAVEKRVQPHDLHATVHVAGNAIKDILT